MLKAKLLARCLNGTQPTLDTQFNRRRLTMPLAMDEPWSSPVTPRREPSTDMGPLVRSLSCRTIFSLQSLIRSQPFRYPTRASGGNKTADPRRRTATKKRQHNDSAHKSLEIGFHVADSITSNSAAARPLSARGQRPFTPTPPDVGSANR
jgi:hypothetical protein